ncbi:MAG: RluA family pseudouridine synthase [Oscillospiraceae bacterium]|jgi:23S rRNA pseudouridine1911/1915/1917 synthase|nr:RluA family pseudouridine synthase [Oscillospiraceae bacterium]
MKKNFEILVTEENNKERLDKFLSIEFRKFCESENKELFKNFKFNCFENLESYNILSTRSKFQKLLKQGEIFVNNKKTIKKNHKILKDDVISFSLTEPSTFNLRSENIPLKICYEDEYLLVVNKPRSMVVHPAPGHFSKTLVNALMFHCKDNLSKAYGKTRLGIVHRLDKDTSGLLVVAKNDYVHAELAKQLKNREFLREYEAVVCGVLKEEQGIINAPIGRSCKDRKKMCVTLKNSRHAVTHFDVLEKFLNFSHIKLKLETGRTHQIRVHMKAIGHPVAGDPLYSFKKNCLCKKLKGQCLHAKTIGFFHPKFKKQIYLTTDLPDYFKEFLTKIKSQNYS